MLQNYLPHCVQQKIKQLVYQDLISRQHGHLYKEHTSIMIQELEKIINQEKVNIKTAQQLIAAAYVYHWGCCLLHDQPGHFHTKPLQHLPICFHLSAVKAERFYLYHFSKLFTQKQILEIADALEQQAFLENNTNKLAVWLQQANLKAIQEIKASCKN